MKVKATVSFAGQICMAANEVRDVPEDVAAPLLACGYLETVEPPKAPGVEPPAGGTEPPVEKPELPAEEPESKEAKQAKAKKEK